MSIEARARRNCSFYEKGWQQKWPISELLCFINNLQFIFCLSYLFSIFFDLSPRENGGKFSDNAQEEKKIEMKTGGEIYEFEFSQRKFLQINHNKVQTMPGILCPSKWKSINFFLFCCHTNITDNAKIFMQCIFHLFFFDSVDFSISLTWKHFEWWVQGFRSRKTLTMRHVTSLYFQNLNTQTSFST